MRRLWVVLCSTLGGGGANAGFKRELVFGVLLCVFTIGTEAVVLDGSMVIRKIMASFLSASICVGAGAGIGAIGIGLARASIRSVAICSKPLAADLNAKCSQQSNM